MAVYVDDLRRAATVGRLRARWSHLGADTPEELHAFAGAIGMKRAWAQLSSSGIAHYDLTESRRLRAVAAGAVEISARDFVRRLRPRRDWTASEEARSAASTSTPIEPRSPAGASLLPAASSRAT